MDVEIFRKKYTTYFLPKLEYAKPVWSPQFSVHTDLLEVVQRRRRTMTVPEVKELELQGEASGHRVS